MPTIIYNPPKLARADCNWILQHAENIASQSGQDGIIKKIFEFIKPTSKLAIEFGGFDGKKMSNIWRLIVEDLWSGIYIEAIPSRFNLIKVNHPYERVTALNQFITWDGIDTFDATMSRLGVLNDIDLVSIDIDGNDWHVWNAIKAYHPRVVIIEFNPSIPNEVVFIQDADQKVNQGCSLQALINLGKEKGYELICVAGADAYFVREEYYHRFGIPNNTINNMFNPASTVIWQGYDGTLYTAGVMHLAWKGVHWTHDQLQILPPELRYFGDCKTI